MPTFFKAGGHEWQIAINITAVKQVRQALNINLAQLEPEIFTRLVKDPETLVDVIYVLCRREAQERKMSDEDFGRMMAGDVIYEATKAFLDEYVNFVPDPAHRKMIWESLESMRQMEKTAMERAAGAIRKTIPEIQKQIDIKIGEVLKT